jgi:diguanylate cyclase (GGDEF)-like protein
MVTEVTEYRRADEEIRLLQTMTQAIAESKDFNTALEKALQMICETAGWVFGEVWVPSDDGTHLRFSPAWHCKDEGLERFRKASEQFTFPPGVGLPGRAWSGKKSVWIADVTQDTNFPRAQLALKMGLKGAMAIPILSESKVVAVMDFFAFEALGKEDKRLIDAVSAIAIQLGSLIKRKMMEEEIERLATIDKLTQAYNRAKFDEIIEREMERSKRHSRPLSLLMFDIDHFKDVNDAYGHVAGDYVLKTIAEIVRKNMRKIDYFVRWGGEEFMIIASETDLETARETAERLRKIIGNYRFDKAGVVTVSFGITQLKKDDTADTFIKRTDDSLYKAKANGRNRVEVSFSEMENIMS